jgi:hypothetical protein
MKNTYFPEGIRAIGIAGCGIKVAAGVEAPSADITPLDRSDAMQDPTLSAPAAHVNENWQTIPGVKNPARRRADGCVELRLNDERVAVIEAADLAVVGRYRWSAKRSRPGHYYAKGEESRSSATPRKPVSMHQLLCECPPGCQPDHRNGDKLDNRRTNLRPATRAEQSHNTGKQTRHGKASSPFKGVQWCKQKAKWQARIYVNKTNTHLGFFDDPADAARAFDAAAIKHRGEFARVNFPEPQSNQKSGGVAAHD